MTLPVSGAISMAMVNTELGRAANANVSLTESAVRSMFGKSSGAISMSDGYGKNNKVFTLVAGAGSGLTGFSINNYGSISPSAFAGYPFKTLQTTVVYQAERDPYNQVSLSFSDYNVPVGLFVSMTVNGVTLLRANASYYHAVLGGSRTVWVWDYATIGIVPGTAYPIVFT